MLYTFHIHTLIGFFLWENGGGGNGTFPLLINNKIVDTNQPGMSKMSNDVILKGKRETKEWCLNIFHFLRTKNI